MLKNVLYLSSSVILFFLGIVIYGLLLNVNEITLAEAIETKGISKLENIRIVIEKDNYTLKLFSDTTLLKDYKVVFGKNENSVKKAFDDYATPIGSYFICSFDTANTYYKLLKLNYPNNNDAAVALREKIISKEDFINIINAFKNNECPPGNTILGSNIGIHGIGKYNFIFKNLPFVFNWTNGSIAMSNENIDELYSVVDVGTKVLIK